MRVFNTYIRILKYALYGVYYTGMAIAGLLLALFLMGPITL